MLLEKKQFFDMAYGSLEYKIGKSKRLIEKTLAKQGFRGSYTVAATFQEHALVKTHEDKILYVPFGGEGLVEEVNITKGEIASLKDMARRALREDWARDPQVLRNSFKDRKWVSFFERYESMIYSHCGSLPKVCLNEEKVPFLKMRLSRLEDLAGRIDSSAVEKSLAECGVAIDDLRNDFGTMRQWLTMAESLGCGPTNTGDSIKSLIQFMNKAQQLCNFAFGLQKENR